ncbi:hypothetical protein LY474_15225 [Myxococcus stipitatus]|uniref:hypothetical protein n=1 Tax=Myxococcus stipitatus TaxID=83455 RepID=UPI001F47CFF2|nr:hypothetical protein [Myxococcus stipitatus]MCE9669163.1 hypothetical protein [Myxococcus stipitatus]
MHPSPVELQRLLSSALSLERGSPEQLQHLERLRGHCPSFVPGLLLSSRAMLWGKEDVPQPDVFFDEVERILHHALDASNRSPEALIGMARFQSVVRDAPAQAEALYREAATKALSLLEESWAGLIEAQGEQEKTAEAVDTATRASQVFPASESISEARRFAGLPD